MTKKEALLLDLLESEDPKLREIYLANFSVERPSAPLLEKVVAMARLDGADKVRTAAITTLARFWPHGSVLALFDDILRSGDATMAAAVVRTMTDMEDELSAELLFSTYLGRHDFQIKGAVVLALDRRPFGSVKAFLMRHPLNDPDEFLRAMTVTAISKKGDPDVVPALREKLKDTDARVRANAAEGLGRFLPMVPGEVFADLLKDPNHRVQTAALKALFRLGWNGIERHVDQMARSSVGLFRESAAYFLREVRNADHAAASAPREPRELRMPIPVGATVH
jgi:HEAT repeat protein